ncbi:MAG: hypothetical protein PHH14_04200 [Candidatus Margulisbacteria bacterium]|nr:hypothetical protein [Candidatus Margulisiibacteriota bacterium]
MKRIAALVLLLICFFSLTMADTALAATAKKTTKKATTTKKKTTKKYRSRRISRSWPKGGPRPVFPVEGGKTTVTPVKVVAAEPVVIKPKTRSEFDFIFEGGVGGGGLLAEMMLGRQLNDNIYLRAGVGLGAGSGYSVVVLDPIIATYIMKNGFALGLGLNYGMFSSSTGSVFGIELLGEKNFGAVTGRLGYSTALGLRLSAGWKF